MTSLPNTSFTLLRAARRGDSVAWGRIVDIYGPIVFLQCKRNGLSEEDASDATQEVFVAIHSGLQDFKKEQSDQKFSHWIRRITSFKIADRFRIRKKREHVLGGSMAREMIEQIPEQDPIEWEPNTIRRDAFRRAVELMKQDFQESTWRAFWLTVVEGKTTPEVCEILEMKPGAVRNAKSKVRTRLVAELGDVLDME